MRKLSLDRLTRLCSKRILGEAPQPGARKNSDQTMTSTEYDRTRFEALPEAFRLVAEARQSEWKNTTGPIWQKLFRVGEAINKQLAAEVAAYFAEVKEAPDPEPRTADAITPGSYRVPNGWKQISADADRQERERNAPVIDVTPQQPGLNSLLATAAKALPFNRANYPTHQPTTPWYSDPATIARCLQQTDAQRIAGVISDHGISASVRPTPGGSYTVEVAQRDEARANRALALAEEEAHK